MCHGPWILPADWMHNEEMELHSWGEIVGGRK